MFHKPSYSTSMKGMVTVALAIMIVTFILPGVATAAPPPDSNIDQCIECHEPETDAWFGSPHAAAVENGELAATCEGCHGPYVEDHPETGIMQLTVDSSICHDCHADTFGQWEDTTHAEAGVQCIGCHMSHSQEFRLTDDNKCGSCHRERQQDFAYTAHGMAQIACTECHVDDQPAAENVTFIGNLLPQKSTPSHDFTVVNETSCLDCHTEDAHNGLPPNDADHVTQARLVNMAESVPEITAKLEEVERFNQSLLVVAPVALGLGIGLGGILGIVFTMVFGYYVQRRTQ